MFSAILLCRSCRAKSRHPSARLCPSGSLPTISPCLSRPALLRSPRMTLKPTHLDATGAAHLVDVGAKPRSEEHTSELQSLMRNSYAVFCLKKKKTMQHTTITQNKST